MRDFGDANAAFDLAVPAVASNGAKFMFLLKTRDNTPETELIQTIKQKHALAKEAMKHKQLEGIQFIYVYMDYLPINADRDALKAQLPENTVLLDREAMRKANGDSTLYIFIMM